MLNCCNVAIVDSRPINSESCISCLFISLELHIGRHSGIYGISTLRLNYLTAYSGPQSYYLYQRQLSLIPFVLHTAVAVPEELPSTVRIYTRLQSDEHPVMVSACSGERERRRGKCFCFISECAK